MLEVTLVGMTLGLLAIVPILRAEQLARRRMKIRTRRRRLLAQAQIRAWRQS
jgi:hypothetical protein